MTVTLYTGPACGGCIATKHQLAKAGIKYIELPAADHVDDGAGLLAPGLPEPDKDSPFPGTSWAVCKEHGGVYSVTSRNGLVYAPGDAHSPAEARAMALALLAAAAHAEQETQ